MGLPKGRTNNPNGRPKKKDEYAEIIRKLGKRRVVQKKDPKTGELKFISRKEALAEVLWKKAIEGNDRSITEILDRMDGKPMQKVEADVAGDMTLSIGKPVAPDLAFPDLDEDDPEDTESGENNG